MLYPHDIEQKLGFDKIRALISEKCTTDLGKSIVEKVKFSSNYDLINKLLAQTKEYQNILISSDSLSLFGFADIQEALEKSKTEGTFCSENEIFQIGKFLNSFEKAYDFFSNNSNNYPHLYDLCNTIEIDKSLLKQIEKCIDEEGNLKDDASPELQRIRGELRSKYSQVRKSLYSIFKQSEKEGWVPEGASVTVRDGRMVIPILAEFKRRLPGFIHDESASGNTVYLEPTNVLQGNNEIRQLEYAEKREKIKILTGLTNRVRINLPDIRSGLSFISKLDFIRAKAKFSNEIEAIVPKIKNTASVSLRNARHPLLLLSFMKEGKKVVPLNVQLTEKSRILIISGPNAGGKSVSLKTIGLLQFMIQSGIPIPVGEESELGMFEDILIDIGDEQSIENDLSTYSSHLKSMKSFLKNGTSTSLCLIDEFGTGTDPQFGGAIAQAVLSELNNKKVSGVITTHYSNIKHFAEKTEGIINGAMRFDMQKLEPLFELEVGKPGSSFSLEIAKKIGLNSGVIDYAKELIGDKAIDVDQLLNQLEKQKQQIKQRDEELKKRELQAANLQNQYSTLKEELDKNKKEIISKAKEEAARLLKDTNREIEKTIRHIKSNKAQKTETKRARERLQNLKQKVDEPKEIKKAQAATEEQLNPGDTVQLIDQEVTGTVISMKGNDVEVQIGLLKSKVKKNRLIKISKGKEKTIKKERAGSAHGMNLTSKFSEFNSTLDIRGKRVEEVLTILDQFLDDAILFGLSEVKVLHGKGNGVLREVLRNYCKTQSFISNVADEHIERGGAGITVITLN
ncbi:endonuclease MutS2 [Fulvivirga lutea]|uniref:Endonuclease MutS2 n=1 Tax=Fulvivirga lutea TaxID=2810512 RepID=A0A974WP64_9BACT|nr:endonuclease MutS2 [Fulvivirga lutea]QSE99093.1 endonuclease MutS2 [Fulvivirga lutea]